MRRWTIVGSGPLAVLVALALGCPSWARDSKPILFETECHMGACGAKYIAMYIITSKLRIPKVDEERQEYYDVTTKTISVDQAGRERMIASVRYYITCDEGIEGTHVIVATNQASLNHGSIEINSNVMPTYAETPQYSVWWAICKHQPMKFSGESGPETIKNMDSIIKQHERTGVWGPVRLQ